MIILLASCFQLRFQLRFQLCEWSRIRTISRCTSSGGTGTRTFMSCFAETSMTLVPVAWARF